MFNSQQPEKTSSWFHPQQEIAVPVGMAPSPHPVLKGQYCRKEEGGKTFLKNWRIASFQGPEQDPGGDEDHPCRWKLSLSG